MADDSLGGVSEIIRLSLSDGSALVSGGTMTASATGMRGVSFMMVHAAFVST